MMTIRVCFRSTKKDQPTANVIQLTFDFLEDVKAEERILREAARPPRRARRKASTNKTGGRS